MRDPENWRAKLISLVLATTIWYLKAGQPNEKKISDGRVSLQTNWTYSAMGPLASSIG
jgi:hypothetical protein